MLKKIFNIKKLKFCGRESFFFGENLKVFFSVHLLAAVVHLRRKIIFQLLFYYNLLLNNFVLKNRFIKYIIQNCIHNFMNFLL